MMKRMIATGAQRLIAAVKRDGFLKDVISGRDVNDRDRWLLRGQGQPTASYGPGGKAFKHKDL